MHGLPSRTRLAAVSQAVLGLLLTGAVWADGGTTISETRVGDRALVTIRNQWYFLTVEPARAGRITSLKPAGSQTELAYLGLGIGNVDRPDMGGGFDLKLDCTPHTFADRLELELSSTPAERELLGGLDYTKTYIFREDTPFIQVRIRLINHGAGTLVNWRLYSDISTSADLKAMAFQEAAQAENVTGVAAWAENNPALAKAWKIWDRAGSGWGGVSTGLGYTILFKTDPRTVHEVLTFAGGESAAYEVRFRDALDRGDTIERSIFFAVAAGADGRLALESFRAQPAALQSLETTLTKETSVRVDDTVRLDEKADRALIVGRAGRYRLYRTEAVAELPEFAGKTDYAQMIYGPRVKTLYGFPVSARGVMKYRLMVFIDTPASYLPASSWKLVEGFIRAGGTAVFVGDHAVGYENTAIEKLLPARFDYTATVENVHQKVMNDRTPSARLETGPVASDLVSGLDWTSAPQVAVHKNVARAGAEVLLKIDRWPVLTRWRMDQGTVYSFPICLTANYTTIYDDEAIGLDERAKSIFLWPGYANLWRGIAARSLHGDNVATITRLEWQRSGDGNAVTASFAAVNLPAKATAAVEVSAAGRVQRTKTTMRAGSGSVSLDDASPFAELEFCLKIMDGRRELVRVTGKIPAGRPVPFVLTAGHWNGLCRVFRRDCRVPFSLDFKETTGQINVELIDPWKKSVWSKLVSGKDRVEEVLPLEGLTYGRYVVRAEAAGYRQEETLEILPDYTDPDYFYIWSLDFFGGVGETDEPEVQKALVRQAKEEGLNFASGSSGYNPDLQTWKARYLRAGADLAMPAGIVPFHHAGAFFMNQLCGGLKTDDEKRQHLSKQLAQFDNIWGMAPAGVPTYIYDEPQIGHSFVTPEEYARQFGGAPPRERTDPGYYACLKLNEEGFVKSMLRFSEIWRELDKSGSLRPFGLTNEGGGLMEHALWMARAFPGYGVDLFSDSPGNWQAQYAFEMALAACDFDPATLGYQIEAGSYYGGTPIAAQRGQATYSALARGARILDYFEWYSTSLLNRLGIMPERFTAVHRAALEAQKIGPVLGGMKRPQGKLAMLVPNAVQALGVGQARAENDEVLRLTYQAAQVSCGIVDFLYYQHLREGKLKEYQLLLLAGNDWIETAMLPIIEAWVRAGGTLIVMPRSGLIGDDLKPSELYTRLCPLTWGTRCDNAPLAGTPIKTGMAWKLTAQGGRQLYAYEDGSAAAVEYALDKGRAAVFGFVPADAFGLESIFADLKLEPSSSRSSDAEAAAWLLGTGAARYVVAINSENRAKQVEFTLNLDQPELHAIDMLSGKPLPLSRDGKGRIVLPLALEPFWGRAVALLPQAPAKLAVVMPERAVAGQVQACQLRLLDAKGKQVAGKVPVQIAVRDASGRERPEFGGCRVIHDGRLEVSFKLGVNDPPGKWTVTARETWSGVNRKAKFSVVADK